MTDETIFATALEKTDPAERAAFLAEACGDDTARRKRLEGLLIAHARAASFLERPPGAVPDPDHGATQAVTGNSDPGEAAAQTTGGENGTSDDEPLTFLDPPGRPDSLGRIEHYEVLQVLGRGGFGIVFRAFDEMLQRVVALKVMAPQLAATSPARKRFLREARSSAQVRHENVVQVYEVAEQPLPYLAMEFIPGETLQQKLNRVGPLDVPEVLRIGRQIAEGLAAAHAMDLIHRDIKPGNVLLEGGQHKVKITDFGLARTADDASISQSGIIAGTPMYMAPEQALGQTLDQRADLFSLGSVLYQMVTGRPPFRASTAVAVLKRVAEDKPRAIREIIPEMPQWLCDIIAKLHAKSPDDRYQSAREVADVLADCEAQLKANAKLKDYSRIPRGKPQRSGRRKWIAVAAAVLLPVLALTLTEVGGVTHLFRGRQPERTANTEFEAREAQEAAAKQLGIPVETTNTIDMKFVLIPPGKFTMGSSKEEIDSWLKQTVDEWVKERLPGEVPQHRVEITHPIYMGQTEVTVGQFRQFVTATGYKTQAERKGGAFRHFPSGEWKMDADTNWLNPGFAQIDDHPVVCVSWSDAVEFCNWLSKQEGKHYRLPTEAEWEYSCRAGSKGQWAFGDNEGELLNYARMGNNSQLHPSPVAGLKQNAWGLYDMHGNATEWCQDVYNSNYYKTSPPNDPPGPGTGNEHVLRGGSCFQGPVWCRSAFRGYEKAGFRWDDLGFRVVQLVSPPAKPSSTPIAPFTDTDVQGLAALPAAQQVAKVREALMRRNPGFDGKFEHKIEDGVVTEFRVVTDHVTDIAPIRVWSALRVLDCSGTWNNFKPNGLLADLTPLKGMNLAALTYLKLSCTQVGDAGMVYFKDCQNLTHIDLFLTQVSDAGLIHFKECKDLTHLYLGWTKVSDAGLAHFKDCKNLTDLWVNDDAQVGDAGMIHFQDCKALRNLNLAGTKVSDAGLARFKDCKNLKYLYVDRTQVDDAGLAPFKAMPLRELNIDNTGITDLTSLQGMSLEHIRLTPKNITRGMAVLRDMKSLETIGVAWKQAWPAAEFWERYDKGEFSSPAAVLPSTDADAERIAALPAAQQVEEVRKELMRRNPDFDGKVEHKIEEGVVTELRINTHKVTDITPIRVFNALRVLECSGTYTDQPNGLLADLTPLEGMNLAGLKHLGLNDTKVTDAGMVYFKDCKDLRYLNLSGSKVTDRGLVHFKDCKALTTLWLAGANVHDAGLANFKDCKNLTELHLQTTQVGDVGLAHLKDCTSLRLLDLGATRVSDAGLIHFKDCKALTQLRLGDTRVSDAGLSHLKAIPLKSLWIDNTAVTDLTALRGMPLEDIRLTPKNITRGLDILRAMKSLKTIGISWEQSWPAEEFWERYDKGEFKE